jgi:hypothetical protein
MDNLVARLREHAGKLAQDPSNSADTALLLVEAAERLEALARLAKE